MPVSVRPALLFLFLFCLVWSPDGRAQTAAADRKPLDYVEQMPEYPGGIGEIVRHLSTHIKYPRKALKQGIRGKVYVKFVVDETGQVRDPVVQKGIGNGCDAEAVRVIRELKRFKPGINNGQPVAVYFNVPVAYSIKGLPAPTTYNPSFQPDEGVVYDYPEEPAIPAALDIAQEGALFNQPAMGRKGVVIVSQLVDVRGRASQASVVSRLDPLADSAALRAVAATPRWRPARQGGVAVPSHSSHLVIFGFERRPDVFNAPEEPTAYLAGEGQLGETLKLVKPQRVQGMQAASTVYVRVIIDANGQVTAPEVLQGQDADSDAEALRVVQGLGRFTPARHHGQAVSQYRVLPVQFMYFAPRG